MSRQLFALLLLLATTYPVTAQLPQLPSVQVGPAFRIGPDEATVGGVGVKNGQLAVPTVDQMINTAIDSTAPGLSDADKNNVRNAIKTTGYVTAVASDPVLAFVVISLVGKDGKTKDVVVPTNNAASTGKSWTFTATCIVQQEKGLITALFNDDPQGLDQVGDGDTVNLTAPYCEAYKEKSVTAVAMRKTGLTNTPDATPPLFRHYLVGRTT